MTREEAIAQIDERRRAEARAKLLRSRVSREPIPGKPDAFAVRVDGRQVGLLRRSNAVAQWSAVYLEHGADLHLGTWHGKAIALQQLKQHVVREAERRVAAELALAATIARDLWPHGLIANILLRIRSSMLTGILSPAVATMNAMHALAEVTGVDASETRVRHGRDERIQAAMDTPPPLCASCGKRDNNECPVCWAGYG